eukprot:5452739-Amphidinium_carterae.1
MPARSRDCFGGSESGSQQIVWPCNARAAAGQLLRSRSKAEFLYPQNLPAFGPAHRCDFKRTRQR